MASLALSPLESDLWPPHSWPLRHLTAIICSWSSALILRRLQHALFLQGKVKSSQLALNCQCLEQLHNDNYTQVCLGCQQMYPIGPRVPFSPRRMLSDCSPPMSPSLRHQQPCTRLVPFTLSGRRLTPTTHVWTPFICLQLWEQCWYRILFSLWYQISHCIYIFPIGLQDYKGHVFSGGQGIPPHAVIHTWWWRTFIDKPHTWSVLGPS